MNAIGTAFLALSGLLALPLLLNAVRPFWWKEWFGNPETAPSVSEVANAIIWAERSGYAAVAVGLIGLALIGLSCRSTPRETPNR